MIPIFILEGFWGVRGWERTEEEARGRERTGEDFFRSPLTFIYI